MREIKFRFWGPLGDWEEPDEMERKKTMLYGDEFAWEEYEPINDLFAGLDDTIPMQYIGLHDKSGKEIYESDLVTDGINPPITAVWSYPLLARLAEIEVEVIGNIYENPELLKEEQ